MRSRWVHIAKVPPVREWLQLACLLSGLISALSVQAASLTVINDSDLLETVFAANSVVSRQRLELDENLRQHLDKRFHIATEITAVDVWKATAAGDGRLLGAMIRVEEHYQHRPVTLAIAMSAEQRIIRAAIVSIDTQLEADFVTTIGTGYLQRYTMLSARQLSYLATVLARQGGPSGWVGDRLSLYGAILATIIETGILGQR